MWQMPCHSLFSCENPWARIASGEQAWGDFHFFRASRRDM
jgi:hypothetical protein